MSVVDTAERTYSGPALARLTGATYRCVDHWTRVGLLPETAHGSGSKRRFTETEVDTVRLVVHLLAAGFVLDTAFAIARTLAERDEYTVALTEAYELSIRVRPDLLTTPTEETP